jgi:uncharacterized membrane protein
MSNVLSAISIALGVVVLIAIVKEFLDEKADADKRERAERREVLRQLYAANDDMFLRQLAREQTFRDAAREEAE